MLTSYIIFFNNCGGTVKVIKLLGRGYTHDYTERIFTYIQDNKNSRLFYNGPIDLHKPEEFGMEINQQNEVSLKENKTVVTEMEVVA